MTVYLGLDYGTQYLGVAYADGDLANSIPSLRMDDKGLDDKLRKLCEELKIEIIVIGQPGNFLQERIVSFGSRLSKLCALPVIYHPEDLSSREASEILKNKGASIEKRKDNHSLAAALILEDYLISQKTNAAQVSEVY